MISPDTPALKESWAEYKTRRKVEKNVNKTPPCEALKRPKQTGGGGKVLEMPFL